jgi:outer membrane receptor protein involved in Fe transport
MAYDSEWAATDQVPQRAVQDGTIGRFGYVDPTNGGESHRYSLSLQGDRASGDGLLEYSAWVLDYHLELFSNFTYALDPVNGDQFEQYDDRRAAGGSLAWSQPLSADGRWALDAGLEVRYDDISPVGLYLTTARERHATIREDEVRQTQSGAWAGLETRWTPTFRSEVGLRYDRIDYDVNSDLDENSGSGGDDLVSPKLSLVFGPWSDTEYFVAAGQGFHGNDIRGATTTVDPVDGVTPVDPVTPLVEADGFEAGVRTAILPRMQLSLALFQIEIDSELLFVGDGGTTEASRPSRRRGVEFGLYARPTDWLIVDADLAWSEPRFRDDDPAGDRIPGAVERMASLGITVDHESGWFGGARLRYLGASALIEDNSVRAPGSTLVNFETGRRIGERLRLTIGVFNVFDENASDISYFYESQLPGEAAPVEDIHFHPVEPRTFRLTAAYRF